VRIDLHSHSNASDGTQPPADVVRRARIAGLDVLALTDHDTVAGIPAAATELPPGLTLLLGSEISCATVIDGQRVSVHLLGYLFDPSEPTLAGELAALRRDRETRARAMVDRLNELGVATTWADIENIAGDAPVGRPHVARALVDAGVVADIESAFTEEWIGFGGPAYVPKRSLDPAAAVRLVEDAGGVSVLAHPGAAKRGVTIDDEAIAGLFAVGLGGIEVDHPDHDGPTRVRLRALAGELGLLVTGASDDHGELTGHRLGCETTSVDTYDAIVAAATGMSPIRG
jgi:predicted metal-dependent phosphoesterase TrpH